MSKLEEFYKLRDNMRENFPNMYDEEQWRQNEEKLLQEELAPSLEQLLGPALSGVRIPAIITIDYDPQNGIRVKFSCKGESDVTTMTPNLQDGIEDETSGSSSSIEIPDKPMSTRSESIGFTVRFPDGTVVQRKNAKETMIATLKVIGLHRAAAFRGRLFKGFPLVSRNERMDAGFKCQELVDGWYIYTNMGNEVKVDILRQISDELSLGLVIKDETGNDITYTSDSNKSAGKRILYKLNGDGPYSKRELVLLAVTQYVMEHPNFTYAQFEQTFPKNLQGSYGVIRPMSWIKEKASLGTDHLNRYYVEEKDLLTSSDGIKFAVCKEWGDNFANFKSQVQKLGWEISEG
nr:hypothetical protein [uncultured Prevotella sp.]